MKERENVLNSELAIARNQVRYYENQMFIVLMTFKPGDYRLDKVCNDIENRITYWTNKCDRLETLLVN